MAEEKPAITSIDIDEAIAAARIRGDGRFSVDAVIKLLPGRKSKALTERVERSLDSDDDFFNDGDGNYLCRSEFFRNGYFLITPDELEIDEGILFPGHRFSPFIPSDVFPSEVKLHDPDGGEVRQKNYHGRLAELFPYHLLMGSEQVFDFLIAEHAGNRRLSESATGRERIVLRVFDLAEFYAGCEFSSGDALCCRIEDYRRGVFSFEHLPGNKRKSSAVKSFCRTFETALEQVIDRFDNYFDIPEQLSWAFYCAPPAILTREGATASLDEFIRETKAVEIDYSSGATVLARRRETAAADGALAEVPEGVRVSRGETDSVEDLLLSIGTAITVNEIDAFIEECCYYREFDFEVFYARCFGAEELNFADEAQRAVFLNFVEDRWETVSGNYNREPDEPKAAIRSAILEVVEARSAYLAELRQREDGEPPEGKLRKLAELAIYLNDILKLIQVPDYQADEEETEAILETVAGIAETQQELIETEKI